MTVRGAVCIVGLALGLSASVLSACAAANSANGDTAPDEPMDPDELEKQFFREADPIQKHPVKGGQAWRAYLEAQAAPAVEAFDGYLSVTADLGWDSDVQCLVYEGQIDAGSASNTFIREAAKSVEFRRLGAYNVDHDGLDPILNIRGIYHVDQDGVIAAGDYKLMIMPRLEYPVVCLHDAPGYAESFARVAAEFARSFEFESAAPRPMRGELWLTTLEDIPVGFTKRNTYEMEDGSIRAVDISARFLPTSPNEIAFEDQVSVVTSDAKGNLVSGKYASFENGESSVEVELEKGKGRSYDYSGTVQDKDVSGSFKARVPLVGQYALERRLRKLAGKQRKKSKFDQWEYTPSLDPSQASKVSYEVAMEDGEMRIEASMGKRSLLMRANPRGVVKQLLMRSGSRMIVVNLVEEVGEL